MTDRVFFYGTLMTGFDRRRRAGIDPMLVRVGRGYLRAALFDLGIYPAAVPASDDRVWGEVYQVDDEPSVLGTLDEIEGYAPDDPDHSLYVRGKSTVSREDGRRLDAWVYFYNAPLGQAQKIPSGDYLDHVKAR